MKRKLASSGYTIIEVLIFLAVSGALLVSVMALISGQQAKTEFTATLRDFESQMQDILNDVATGSYPPMINGCIVTSGAPAETDVAQEQGTSQQCTFVGKAIQFVPQGTNQDGIFDLYTVTGRRQVAALGMPPQEVNSIQEASPRVLNGVPKGSGSLNSSLQFKKVLVNGVENYGFAMVSGFGQTESDGVVSGTAGTTLIGMPNVITKGDSGFTGKVSALNSANVITSDVVVCIGDGGSGGRLGAVRINGRGTEILFDDDARTVCG